MCVIPQDMSSLMHTIYDVVDASVNQSCHSKIKTLRVKLTVTPEPSPRRREHTTHTGTGTHVAADIELEINWNVLLLHRQSGVLALGRSVLYKTRARMHTYSCIRFVLKGLRASVMSVYFFLLSSQKGTGAVAVWTPHSRKKCAVETNATRHTWGQTPWRFGLCLNI